jgi:hypothetical protein
MFGTKGVGFKTEKLTIAPKGITWRVR